MNSTPFEGGLEGALVEDAVNPGSIFTNALLAGLREGAADVDNDGLVSVDEAYNYAFNQVRARGAAQTPQRWLSGGRGTSFSRETRTGGQSSPRPSLRHCSRRSTAHIRMCA